MSRMIQYNKLYVLTPVDILLSLYIVHLRDTIQYKIPTQSRIVFFFDCMLHFSLAVVLQSTPVLIIV